MIVYAHKNLKFEVFFSELPIPIFPIQNGETPLYIASRDGHTDVVKVLLEHKADPNASSKVSCSLITS